MLTELGLDPEQAVVAAGTRRARASGSARPASRSPSADSGLAMVWPAAAGRAAEDTTGRSRPSWRSADSIVGAATGCCGREQDADRSRRGTPDDEHLFEVVDEDLASQIALMRAILAARVSSKNTRSRVKPEAGRGRTGLLLRAIAAPPAAGRSGADRRPSAGSCG